MNKTAKKEVMVLNLTKNKIKKYKDAPFEIENHATNNQAVLEKKETVLALVENEKTKVSRLIRFEYRKNNFEIITEFNTQFFKK